MKYSLIGLLLVVAAVSCTKSDIRQPDDFTVMPSKTTIAVNDTVTFTFKGSPFFITFYSGEAGKRYAFSKTTQREPDSTRLLFSTRTTAASATTQPLNVNNVSVLVSTDFSGKMDSASIRKATWTDVSSRAVWATTTNIVSSGFFRVDDLKKAGAPFYVAFRYLSDTVKATSLPRKWEVLNVFTLQNHFGDVVYPLAGGGLAGTNLPFLTGGFQQLSLSDNANNWAYANTALTFNAPVTVGGLPNDDWSISRPFDLSLYQADLGVNIKQPNITVPEYKYRFTKAGTYTVTFVAKNTDAETAKEVVRDVVITVQ